MILDRYDETTYMKPIWEGDTVYHEDVLFYRGRKRAKLLYPIDSIVSVRSYDLGVEFEYGSDYTVEDGELVICENSAMPVFDITPFTETPPKHVFSVSGRKDLYLTEADCVVMRRKSVAVTYKHTRLWSDGYSGRGVSSLRSQLPPLFERLDSGKRVNILLYGDSMSTGWGSSGSYSNNRILSAANDGTYAETCLNVPPYSPAWYDMFISVLKKNYPSAEINFDNISLGGTGSKWGADCVSKRLRFIKHKPDIVLLGFAINDACGGMPTDEYRENMNNIIENIKNDENGNKNALFVPFSCHTCNENAECYPTQRFTDYENALCDIANNRSDTAVLKLSTLFADIAKSKEPLDRLENNINHCMDMGGRIYAQAMAEAFK